MQTPDRCIRGLFIKYLKLIAIGFLPVLFTVAASAQLPGQLPVNLKAFKARIVNSNKVEVFWTTEYEKDNGYFEIERSSDGVNFSAVAKIPGVNRHGILTDYTFYDNNPLKGISYYRLKQVDIDTKYNYSAIERIRNSAAENTFDIFPNPAPGNLFKIDLLKNIRGNIDVLVYDERGRLQLKQQFNNLNTLYVNHHLPAAMYLVKITAKDFIKTKLLLVQ